MSEDLPPRVAAAMNRRAFRDQIIRSSVAPDYDPFGVLDEPDEPRLKPSRDGIYPRCGWCNGENYALAVVAYSSGEIPCTAVGGCGRRLPASYVRGSVREDNQ